MTRGPDKGEGGRPALPAEKIRTGRVDMKLTEAELEALESARNEGESLAACVRRLALEATNPPPVNGGE